MELPQTNGCTSPDMFIGKPANEWISEAARMPDPVKLWKSFWFENEVACLFADTNMGKSIYAIQIGEWIARQGRRVAYFDFEMSAKQFQLRYTDRETKQHYRFSDNFMRVEMSQSEANIDDLQYIIRQIENFCKDHQCHIAIIDNISWITNRFESGDAAGELMQELISLKRRLSMSLLVLAHTPKRNVQSMLTQNSLAGSKRLANFMDALFAIGKAVSRGPEYRYIKQLKIRSGEMIYDTDNVILCRIVKDNGMLQFQELGFENEIELLASDDDTIQNNDCRFLDVEKRKEIENLLKENVPQRQICSQLKVSGKTVRKVKAQMNFLNSL